MKHTVRSLYANAGVTIVGNVAYLSNKDIPPQALGKWAKHLPEQAWFRELTGKLGFPLPGDSWRSGWLTLMVLQQAMDHSGSHHIPQNEPFFLLDRKSEPDWMNELPLFAKRYIRCSYAAGEGMDPLAIVPKFPYMGFGYVLPDTGMPYEATQVFNLHRLSRIRQLSFLHDPVIRENGGQGSGLIFDHTRYCHVLDVHAVGNLIASNIGLSEMETNTLNTATISHDALTPAGGDSVKLIDPAALDEDAHYPELLVGDGWEAYRERFGIDRELLVKTIMGEGLLGCILDIADKSSYLARDVDAYLKTSSPKKDIRYPNLYMIADIVSQDPYVCAVWQDAWRCDGSLVFNNAERLARFLKLRALMFRNLYYNPYSRFFEYLIGKGVVKYMYQSRQITRKELLEHDDHWIERKVDEALGTYLFLSGFHFLENSRVEEHPDMESAAKRAGEFDGDPSVIVILDDFKALTSNGVKKFLVRKDRKTAIFAEAYPEDALQIEEIMTFQKKVRLFFFDMNDLRMSLASRKKLKGIMKSVS